MGILSVALSARVEGKIIRLDLLNHIVEGVESLLPGRRSMFERVKRAICVSGRLNSC